MNAATQQREKDPYIITLKNVRAQYLHVFEPFKPKNPKPEDKKKFNCTVILPMDHPQLESVKALIRQLVETEYKDKQMPKSTMRCFRMGEETDPIQAGHYILSANEERRPYALSRNNQPTTAEDDVLYPGCYVDLAIRLWAQHESSGWGRRINANFLGVRFAGDGERLAGQRPAVEDLFDDAGTSAADDKGGDPFDL